jgi:hypothetical protein
MKGHPMTLADPVSPDLKRHLRTLKLGQLLAIFHIFAESQSIRRRIQAEARWALAVATFRSGKFY